MEKHIGAIPIIIFFVVIVTESQICRYVKNVEEDENNKLNMKSAKDVFFIYFLFIFI